MTDSGDGGTVEDEVDTDLNTNPQTLTSTLTLTSSETGSWIRFKLRAINSEDSTDSRVVQYMLATVSRFSAN